MARFGELKSLMVGAIAHDLAPDKFDVLDGDPFYRCDVPWKQAFESERKREHQTAQTESAYRVARVSQYRADILCGGPIRYLEASFGLDPADPNACRGG